MTATHTPVCPNGTEARKPPCDAPCAQRDRPWVLAATILASSMAFIDGTVLHVALPAIQATFAAPFSSLQWIVNGYTLMLGALLLAGGALGDQAGRRRIFCGGIILFALASIACALAPNAQSLIASRIVQGVGAALMVPQSLAIIAASFPRPVRGRAIGTWAACSALTTTAGPVIGGLLIDSVSWRAVFWINVPLAAVALLLTARHMPESRSAAKEPIDWPGAAIATLTLGALTYALTRWPRIHDAVPFDLLAALALGIAGAGAFVWIERRTAAPLVPPALFRARDFSGLNVMTLLLYAALSGALFLLPYNLIQLQGYTATQAGLALMPLGLLIGVLSRHAGQLSDRIGPRAPLIAGPLLVAAGCGGLAVPGIGGGYFATFFVPVILIALGMALAVSPLTTAVMNAAPDDRSGAASGVNNAASRIAGLIAVALSGALATALFTIALETRLEQLNIAGEHARQLVAEAEKLAELTVPDSVSSGLRSTLERVIDEAFLTAFRAGALLNAAFAALAAGIAALLFRPVAVRK